jgi:hypothetical protein
MNSPITSAEILGFALTCLQTSKISALFFLAERGFLSYIPILSFVFWPDGCVFLLRLPGIFYV